MNPIGSYNKVRKLRCLIICNFRKCRQNFLQKITNKPQRDEFADSKLRYKEKAASPETAFKGLNVIIRLFLV